MNHRGERRKRVSDRIISDLILSQRRLLQEVYCIFVDGNSFFSLPRSSNQRNPSYQCILRRAVVNKYDAIRAVSISPDGQIIASGGDDATVKLWKQDGTLLNTLKGHTNKVWTISFSPDSQMIASGSWDGKVKLWKRDGTPLKTLNVGDDRVYGVAFSPDGQTIVYVWYCPNASFGHQEEMIQEEVHLTNEDMGTEPMSSRESDLI